MSTLLIPFQVVLGVVLAIAFTLVPSISLAGMLIANWFGEITLISYFAANLVFSTYREIALPITTADPVILSTYSYEKLPVLDVKAFQALARQKFILLIIGITISMFFSNIGFNGFNSTIIWLILLFYGVATLKTVNNVIAGFLCILATVGVVKGLDLMGVSTPVVAVITSVGFAFKNLPKEEEKHDANWLFTLIRIDSISFGVITGLIPGLNTSTVMGIASKTNLYINSRIANATAEGISIGILLFQRGTSKTTVTTYLSSLIQGKQIDSTLLLAIILIVGTYCCFSDRAWNLIHSYISKEVNGPSWLDRLINKTVPVIMVLYFTVIPSNPILSIIAAGGLYVFSWLMIDAIRAGIPLDIQKLVVSAPLLVNI